MPRELPARTDVLVVGAGPVGLTLATALTRAGVDTVVIDKATAPAPTSRATVVHARSLEVLRGIGATDVLLSQGIKVPRYTVRDHDRVLLRIDFGTLPTDYPFALMIPQHTTERILADRLGSVGGAVLRDRELAHIGQENGQVIASMTDGRTIRARYAVGADGMHSRVREQAGIAFIGGTDAESFVLAEFRLDWNEAADEQFLFFSTEGTALVSPLPGGLHRVVVTVDEAPEAPSLDQIRTLLAERGPRRHPATVKDLVWSSRFRVHNRLAARYRADRIFLAGDAAHAHSPAGGQGLNTGVQDAIDLAGRLIAVLQDGADDTVLDGYETQRRPVAEDVLAFTHQMTRMATLRGRPLRELRNISLRGLGLIPAVRRSTAMNLSELATATTRRR
ncbi:FAD-dependent monooxygenase [Actinomadura rupiterrae]|uniref:FAD-dependent monooxygenase n=1 Tax=Actinomadura rupiterrae TaxID=559627 RepID=UPI0020A2BC44|nr:FAD-dependent monooxygenase [Actinomadura rupiterrae]MCP2342259.1 2-polyprenyl-6-methoxyphenol hydroxylase-like FAD-dependent oxidoreductase [Actinomadura rupiterrae]